jgi:hypothetical protein
MKKGHEVFRLYVVKVDMVSTCLIFKDLTKYKSKNIVLKAFHINLLNVVKKHNRFPMRTIQLQTTILELQAQIISLKYRHREKYIDLE